MKSFSYPILLHWLIPHPHYEIWSKNVRQMNFFHPCIILRRCEVIFLFHSQNNSAPKNRWPQFAYRFYCPCVGITTCHALHAGLDKFIRPRRRNRSKVRHLHDSDWSLRGTKLIRLDRCSTWRNALTLGQNLKSSQHVKSVITSNRPFNRPCHVRMRNNDLLTRPTAASEPYRPHLMNYLATPDGRGRGPGKPLWEWPP